MLLAQSTYFILSCLIAKWFNDNMDICWLNDYSVQVGIGVLLLFYSISLKVVGEHS
ncbi:hypothetical protein BBOV_I003925 [Babesia bovis T2Bo]|uniref:hypothetical protein n=1 Tax=Babesia bovis T2Bo TaxID=484906 RepID=UPI001C350E80|nr:hypothetical protein BBOV_I003925 [Babesia bovis T2Bo]KAG6440207.1 hypothetical protein BBOV_I003925 [Babesia bovis T2Bo]